MGSTGSVIQGFLKNVKIFNFFLTQNYKVALRFVACELDDGFGTIRKVYSYSLCPFKSSALKSGTRYIGSF